MNVLANIVTAHRYGGRNGCRSSRWFPYLVLIRTVCRHCLA